MVAASPRKNLISSWGILKPRFIASQIEKRTKLALCPAGRNRTSSFHPTFKRYRKERPELQSPRLTPCSRRSIRTWLIFEAFPGIGKALRLQESSGCRLDLLQIDPGVWS
jgi:hypothetical protein